MGQHALARAAAGVLLSAQCVLSHATAMAADIAPAVSAAVASGRARVLVELRMPPELGTDSGIAAVQHTVIAGLQGTDAIVLRQYASVPFLALEIGPSALRALERMSEVVRIVEDTELHPSPGRSKHAAPNRRP